MSRTYDSTRRREVAQQTRRDILRAALALHWEGITDFGSIAREAGCSVATVRKHYPTKEHLFRDCTGTFAESLVMPDPAAIAQIADDRLRLDRAIRELCCVHEAMFGYAWHSAYLRSESPTLDEIMAGYEQLADALAEVVVPAESPVHGLVRGLLDFLSWRALRTSGALTPEQATDSVVETIERILRSAASRDDSNALAPNHQTRTQT